MADPFTDFLLQQAGPQPLPDASRRDLPITPSPEYDPFRWMSEATPEWPQLTPEGWGSFQNSLLQTPPQGSPQEAGFGKLGVTEQAAEPVSRIAQRSPPPAAIEAPFPSVAPPTPGVQVGGQEIESPFSAPVGQRGPGTGARWGQPGQPVAIRFNNPGAMEFGDFARQFGGAPGYDNPRYAQFPTPEAGWQATEALLASYLRRGFNTPQTLIARWAPSPENDVGAYVGRVTAALGIRPDTPLTPEIIPQLARAMFSVEAGDEAAAGVGTRPPQGIQGASYEMGQTGTDLASVGLPPGMGQLSPGMMASLSGQPPITGQPQPPAPFSRTATALVPGLQGPPPGVARSGIMGLFDMAGIGVQGPPPTQSPADYFAHLGPNAQRSAAEVFQRGQELRMQNPQAPPDALMQMMLRDPVWGRNAMNLGANAPTVLSSAVNPVPPPGTSANINPGDRRVDASGRTIAEGPPVMPPQAALVNWLQSLPPERQAEAIRLLAASRPAPAPSDREQAMARIEADVAAGRPPNPNDLSLSGRVRLIRRTNDFGQVVEETYIDVVTGQPISVNPRSSVAPQTPPGAQAPGGPPAPVAGPPPPAPGAGAYTPPQGVTFGAEPWRPGQPIPREVLSAIQNGVFGGTSPFNMFVGGQDDQGGLISLTQAGPQSGTTAGPQDVGRPRPLDTRVRRVRLGDREFNDIPGLTLQDSLLPDPAEMFLAAGPFAAARSFYGRLGAALGGQFATTEEAVQTRGAYLSSLRAAMATLDRGTRLRGEHDTAMATIPEEESIRTSPVRALTQGIILRQRLVANYSLAQNQATSPELDENTRKAAASRMAQIQGVLQLMPSMEGMQALRGRLLGGERPPGTTMPGFDEVAAPVKGAVGQITGTPSATAPAPGRIPGDITDATRFPPQRLVELAKQPNVSEADKARIRTELERRVAAGQ